VGDVRLHVADAAVAAMAVAAARSVPGVLGPLADVAPTLIRVAIVTRLGDNCRDIAAAVQRVVTQTLAELTGHSAQVEVTVADVLRT
jgi:hypothetical protein